MCFVIRDKYVFIYKIESLIKIYTIYTHINIVCIYGPIFIYKYILYSIYSYVYSPMSFKVNE